MNETTTATLSDWSEDEQEFARTLIEIVASKHQKNEREHKELEATSVPLKDITICPKDFENFPHIMQGIRPGRKPESTVREMLRLFWEKDELATTSFRDKYRLSKDRLLYRHLTEKLASTP